jgi:hypothetical protein
LGNAWRKNLYDLRYLPDLQTSLLTLPSGTLVSVWFNDGYCTWCRVRVVNERKRLIGTSPVAIVVATVTVTVATTWGGATHRAARVAATTAVVRGVTASAAACRRRAAAVTPVSAVTVVATVRVAVTLRAARVASMVTVTAVVAVTVVPTVAVPVRVPASTTSAPAAATSAVGVAVAAAAVTHVLARSRVVRAVGHRKVDADAPPAQLDTVELLHALGGVLNAAHADEAESTRTARLLGSA